MRDYYYYDVYTWAINLIHRFQNIWHSLMLTRSERRFKETIVALSEMGGII